MKIPGELKIRPDVVVRMIADIIMVNFVLVAVFAGRFLWLTTVQTSDPTLQGSVGLNYLLSWMQHSAILTILSPPVLYACGLYTRARHYQPRQKVLEVAKAVSISYLIAVLVSLMIPVDEKIPRSVLVAAWGLTVAVLAFARVWTSMWRSVAESETAKPLRAVFTAERPRVLLLGGAGYIGSALLPKLLAKDYPVRLLDLFLFGEKPIEEVLHTPNLEIMKADFRHIDRVTEAMRGVDTVVHLGGIVGDPACSVDEDLTLEVNLIANRMIADVARGMGVRRFVFASSCSVYGFSSGLLDEKSRLWPVSLYARTKLGCERLLLNPELNGSINSVILRFGTIYGFSGRVRFDLVVNLLTAKAVTEGTITVFNGDQWRPFLHVDDAADAILKTVEAPLSLVSNEIFNVGSDDQNYRIRDVGHIIRRLVPNARIVETETDGDRRDYRVSFSKIQRDLGFKPLWTVEKGVEQMIAAFETGRVTDYTASRYSNYKHLCENVDSLCKEDGDWIEHLLNAYELAERRA